MRRSNPCYLTVCSIVVLCGATQADEEAPGDAEAKKEQEAWGAELEQIETEAGKLAAGDKRIGDQLFRRLTALFNKLYNSKHKSHAGWTPLHDRMADLEEQVAERSRGAKLEPREADQRTRDAIAILDELEQELAEKPPSTPSGQVTRTTGMLNRARAALMGAKPRARRSKEWVNALIRTEVILERVKAQAAELAAKPKNEPAQPEPPKNEPSPPEPPKNEPSPPEPSKPEPPKNEPAQPEPEPADGEFKLQPGERPPADPALKTVLPEYAVYEPLDKAARALADALPRVQEWADKNWNLEELDRYADRLEKSVERQDASRSDVQWVRRWVAAYRARVRTFAAEVQRIRGARAAAAQAEASDVSARLDELRAFFNPKTFDSSLAPPLTPQRVRDWIEQLRNWTALPPKGLAELDRLVKDHPKYAKDERITGLRRWFGEVMPKRIQAGIDRTMNSDMQGPGYALRAIGALDNIKEPGRVEWWLNNNGASDSMVEDLLSRFPPAIEACEAKVIFAREYLGKPDAELEAYLPRLRQMRAQIEAGAQRIFENTRMPPAGSTSPELRRIAEKVLADPAAEATPYKRLVIETEPKHEVERRESSYPDGDYIVIKKWTEEYDWFVVATAEKDGVDWRLCFYQLRKYTKALAGDSTYEWYCARRWWGRRIKEENIEK
mgnify:CR=1 FL=1